MKNLYLFVTLLVSLLLSVSAPALAGGGEAPSIIPRPTTLKEMKAGSFVLTQDTVISADPKAQSLADYLHKRLRLNTGFTMPITADAMNGSDNTSIIRLRLSEGGNVRDESYRLTVNPNQIEILANQQQGLFYGIQSLLQLLPEAIYRNKLSHGITWSVPTIYIEDSPRFVWRGLLVDVSRHFINKDQLMRLMDRMAMHKMNILHLHLTDDPGWRIEIKRYPKLTQIGAIGDRSTKTGALYLSQQDIRELLAYAAERFIQIVPEIDMPGHAGAAARAYPEYFDGGVTFNIGKPETYIFIEHILDEVIGLFPGRHIHFGGDELRNHRLLELPEVQSMMKQKGYSDIHELEGYFDRRIADYIISKGRIPIAWDEVARYDLNKQTIIQWWRAHKTDYRDYAADNGHQIIVSPYDHLYLDYAQAPGEPGAPWEGNDNGPNSLQLIYNWEPVPGHFTAEQAGQVIGIEAAVWTEFIRTEDYLEYMVFPRLAAVAEKAWSQPTAKSLAEFKQRLQKQYLRYQQMGINYRQPGPPGDPAAANVEQYLTN